MEWQGYTTAGWAPLLCAVAALEKQYGVRIPWKEKCGRLRLRPQVGFSAEREIPWAEFYGGDAVAAPSSATEAPPQSPLSEDDEADLRVLCAVIEAASINTCQVCGWQGEVRPHRMPHDRWVMNLCEKCAQLRTHVVVQSRGRGHPRAAYVAGMLNDMCNRHRQDLQDLLPLLAEEAQTDALSRILKELPMPSFEVASFTDAAAPSVDATVCERLLQAYAAALEDVASSLRALSCGKAEKSEA